MPEISTVTQNIRVVNEVLLGVRRRDGITEYRDLLDLVKFSAPTISQALSTSRDIGLTKSAGTRGHYILTDIGREYSNFLSYKKDLEAGKVLRKAIIENIKWKEILEYIRSRGGIPFDPVDLVFFVETKLDKKWSKNMRRRMKNGYVSILGYAGLIDMKEGMIISKIDLIPPEKKEVVEGTQETISQKLTHPLEGEEFARLETNDFRFEVRKDLSILVFAETQFKAWITYLKKMINKGR